MSRIGKKAIKVPASVKVSLADKTVNIEGAKGSLSMTVRPEVSVQWDESAREIRCSIDDVGVRQHRAYWGMTRSLIQNMVDGVEKGYEKILDIVGVGWGGSVSGNTLKLQLGYADPVVMPIPEGVTVNAEKSTIRISGADKQAVGQFAAAVRSKRKPEPYNGKGVKYRDEVIRRKQGKQFGA